MDPATYQILGNLKIVTTGLLLRVALQRKLSLLQWVALTLLMVGATTSQINTDCSGDAEGRSFFSAPIQVRPLPPPLQRRGRGPVGLSLRTRGRAP